MKTEIKKLENAVTELTVTFDKEEWGAAKEQAYSKLVKNVKIDGFRAGKAPEKLARARVSTGAAMEEATDIILQANYAKALQEANLVPVAQPGVSVDKMDDEGLTVKFLVPVAPSVELGEYKGLEVVKEEIEVTEEDIKNALANYQNQFAELVIKEGKVELGDTATIDFEGFVDGVAFEGGKGENFPLEIGSGQFIPGFEEQLVGLEAGEEKDVVVTFPENYQAANLAGKEATFKCKVHEIKQRNLPEIDDELAKDVNVEGVETLDQLKEHVTKQLTTQKESQAESKFNDELYKAIIAGSKVEDSDALYEQESNIMLQEIEQNLQAQGMNFELYQQFTGKTKEDIKQDILPQAKDRVKLNLVLSEIVKAEKLAVTSEELDKELEEIAKYYQRELDEVKKIFEGNMERIESDILSRKAIEFVKENLKK